MMIDGFHDGKEARMWPCSGIISRYENNHFTRSCGIYRPGLVSESPDAPGIKFTRIALRVDQR